MTDRLHRSRVLAEGYQFGDAAKVIVNITVRGRDMTVPPQLLDYIEDRTRGGDAEYVRQTRARLIRELGDWNVIEGERHD